MIYWSAGDEEEEAALHILMIPLNDINAHFRTKLVVWPTEPQQ